VEAPLSLAVGATLRRSPYPEQVTSPLAEAINLKGDWFPWTIGSRIGKEGFRDKKKAPIHKGLKLEVVVYDAWLKGRG